MKTDEKRQESGRIPEVSMTSPRELGNQARLSVEQAAERLNRAAARLEEISRERVLHAETEAGINAVLVDLHMALRWLERIGASTQPREI